MTRDRDTLTRTLSLAVHELRTPMTVAAGYLRMLLKDQAGPVSDKQRKMLEEAAHSCARVAAITEEMSDLGKLESKQVALARHDFDLTALLAELATDMLEKCEPGVELKVTTSERLPFTGDRTRLGQAFTALMWSAIRERRPPSVVAIDAQATDRDGERWAVIVIAEQSLVPTLRDLSIEAAPFNEWLGGMGMAVTIARSVVEAHGGTMWSVPDTVSRAASALRLPLGR